MKPRIPRRLREELREALKAARMENAAFGAIYPERITLNGCTRSLDQIIKQESKLYRETWIIPRLEALLAWAEGKDNPDV